MTTLFMMRANAQSAAKVDEASIDANDEVEFFNERRCFVIIIYGILPVVDRDAELAAYE